MEWPLSYFPKPSCRCLSKEMSATIFQVPFYILPLSPSRQEHSWTIWCRFKSPLVDLQMGTYHVPCYWAMADRSDLSLQLRCRWCLPIRSPLAWGSEELPGNEIILRERESGSQAWFSIKPLLSKGQDSSDSTTAWCLSTDVRIK